MNEGVFIVERLNKNQQCPSDFTVKLNNNYKVLKRTICVKQKACKKMAFEM